MNQKEFNYARIAFEDYTNFYLVGGCVRDMVLGRKVKDWDIATPYLPNQLLAILSGSKIINSAQAYPIVTWKGYEIASFRKDGVNRSDAEGIQLGATMLEDAQRRDFTMNAMYYSLDTGGLSFSNFYIQEPVIGSFHDTKCGLIRFVGDPYARIEEDPLRVLRAYRFRAQLGFRFEEKTEVALGRALERVRIRKVWN